MTNSATPPSPPTPHPQRWRIDLLFKNNRICTHMTNYKAPFRVVIINVWFLKWFQVKPVPNLTRITFSVIPVSCCWPCATAIKYSKKHVTIKYKQHSYVHCLNTSISYLDVCILNCDQLLLKIRKTLKDNSNWSKL